MECPRCHKSSPPERETGYDADILCDVCASIEEEQEELDSLAESGIDCCVEGDYYEGSAEELDGNHRPTRA